VALRGLRRRGPTGGRNSSETVKLYYASDVHGSERCWRKFLNAGRFYGASALVMGGDLTGKAIVPVVQISDDRWESVFLGETRTAQSAEDLATLVVAIRDNGMYPWVAARSEVQRHADDGELRDKLFARLIDEHVRRWVEMADDRLERDGIDGFVIAGNDDPWSIDAVLEEGRRLIACEDKVVRIGAHEMVSCAFANPTPWDSPRELTEDALYARLRELVAPLQDVSSAIFNFHAPPYDSGLDTAQKLTEDLTPVFQNGAAVEIPVGSTAVREIIEEYQPLLSLHGHIHESRGSATIGRTVALNTGSDYNSGRIHGGLITLGQDEVASWQFVVG
jgi:uncharacterized protein